MFNRLNNNIQKYFGISRREARGMILLIMICLILILSPLFYRHWGWRGYQSYELDSVRLDSILHVTELMRDPAKTPEAAAERHPAPSRYFDPNVAEFDEMIGLGIDSLLVKRIIKYRNRGGAFTHKEDLLKIYDFPDTLYLRIRNRIRLPDAPRNKGLVDKPREGLQVSSSRSNKPIKGEEDQNAKTLKKLLTNTLDINKADTVGLMKIQGIGPVFSRRILKYRALLGGYTRKDQLKEVYGLSGTSLQNLMQAVYIDSLFQPERIRINFSEWNELVRHPYIDGDLAGMITRNRSAEGPFRKPEDLRRITGLQDSLIIKLQPYLEF